MFSCVGATFNRLVIVLRFRLTTSEEGNFLASESPRRDGTTSTAASIVLYTQGINWIAVRCQRFCFHMCGPHG